MILHPKAPLWQLGFRPFFLFSALFSALAIALWLGFLFARVPFHGTLNLVTWHSHEMIYGFSAAVIAGFVMTASQNWTGKRGVNGIRLQILFAIWVLARVLLVFVPGPNWVSMIADLAFFPILAGYMIPYLKEADLKMERVFFLYFALFFTGNLLVHLDAFELVPGYSRQGILLGLNTVIIVIIFMGGRVIPFFTESSIAKAQPKTWAPIEILAHVTAWLFLLVQFFAENSLMSAGVALAAALVHGIRLYGWSVPRVRRTPILWILHVAYMWIVVGYILTALAAMGYVVSAIPVHAFTVGALGMVIYGMITRVSLGHTGRPLRPALAVVVGYYLLGVSALVRVLLPALSPGLHDIAVVFSGTVWVLAFFIFVFVYAPMLTSPRADSRLS